MRFQCGAIEKWSACAGPPVRVALKAEQVRDFHDECTVQRLVELRISALVVDDINIAERPVSQVKPQVRTEFAGLAVVLKKCVDE